MAHPIQEALHTISTSSVPSRTKELHAHSTAQLRSWATQQARVDVLWPRNRGTDNNLNLQSIYINDPEDVEYVFTFLLPGGEHLVIFTAYGDIILKRIEWGNDIGDSEWVLADVARCSPPSSELAWPECPVKVFTDTICEYPLITYHNWEDARCVASVVDCSPGIHRF